MPSIQQRPDPRQVRLADRHLDHHDHAGLVDQPQLEHLQPDQPGIGMPDGDCECNGEQVHDANVIATMLAHGVGTVVTMSVADFARFERYVSLVEL